MADWGKKIQTADRASTVASWVWGGVCWAVPGLTVAVVISAALTQIESAWNFLGWPGTAVVCFVLWIVSIHTITLTRNHLPKGVKLEPSTWIVIAGAILVIGVVAMTWGLRSIAGGHAENTKRLETIQEAIYLGATRQRLATCLSTMRETNTRFRFSGHLKAAFQRDEKNRATNPPGTFMKAEWLNIQNRLREPIFTQFQSAYSQCFKGKAFAFQPKTLQPGESVEGEDEISEALRPQYRTTFLSWRGAEEAADRAIQEVEQTIKDIDIKIAEKNRPAWLNIQ
jgi:hypothetical protein